MIDPKELRKGNLVVLAHESNAPIVSITQIRSLGVYAEYAPGDGSSYYLFDQLLPIELNPSWLEKMNFLLVDKVWWEIPGMSDWQLLDNDPFEKCFSLADDHTILSVKPLRYVHHLQNLYLDLTEKELAIKSFNQSN